jgi:hypothetical protein
MIKFLKYIVILSLLLGLGCKREYTTEPESGKYGGKWLWVKSVGGKSGVEIKPEEGTKIVRYYKNDTFRLYRNDTLKVLAEYEINGQIQDLDKIVYSDIRTFDYYFDPEIEYARLDSAGLQVWDGLIDGYFSFFTRD